MCGLLRHLDERHGGAEAYATARGLTSSELEALAARLTG
jgi:hypothetical protein